MTINKTVVNTGKMFRGDYWFLSNFYHVPVTYKGIKYPSVECAYQAQKTDSITLKHKFASISSKEAKKLSHQIKSPADWHDRNVQIMTDLLRQKFENPYLRQKLLDTGDELLIENNYWNDTFWGVCNGVGNNMLGKLLMQIRAEIKNR